MISMQVKVDDKFHHRSASHFRDSENEKENLIMRSNVQVRVDRMNERAYFHGWKVKRAIRRKGKAVKGFQVRIQTRNAGKLVGYIKYKKGGVRFEIELLDGYKSDSMLLEMKAIATVQASDKPWDISTEGLIAKRKKKDRAKSKRAKNNSRKEMKERKARVHYVLWRYSVGEEQELVRVSCKLYGNKEKKAKEDAAKRNRMSSKSIYIVIASTPCK